MRISDWSSDVCSSDLLDLGSIGHVSPKRREEFLSFVTALQSGDPGGLADTLALWSEGYDVPRDNVVRAAERLVARHGGGRIVLGALIADFLPILRNERSEEHTSEIQSLMRNSYDVFCLKKTKYNK